MIVSLVLGFRSLTLEGRLRIYRIVESLHPPSEHHGRFGLDEHQDSVPWLSDVCHCCNYYDGVVGPIRFEESGYDRMVLVLVK